MKKGSVVVLLISILLSFVVVEAATRAYFAATEYPPGKNEAEKCAFDFMQRLADPQDGRTAPLDTVYYEYSPHAGIWPTANYTERKHITRETEELGTVFLERAVVQVNNQHTINYHDFAQDTDKTRIAIFGDSFTFGADVPLHYSYPYMLEQMIPESEVINYGVEGVGIDTMYLRWKHEGTKLDPDVTVFAIYIGDIARVRPCIYKPQLLVEEGRIVETNTPAPTYEAIQKSYKKSLTSYFLDELTYLVHTAGNPISAIYQEGFKLLDPILDEVKEHSKYFMVLIIEAGNNQDVSAFEREQIVKLETMLKEKKIPFINSQEVFAGEGYTPQDYSDDLSVGHFMPEGYAILAQGIKNKLESDQVIEKTDNYYFQLQHSGHVGTSSLWLYSKQDELFAWQIPVYKLYTADGQEISIRDQPVFFGLKLLCEQLQHIYHSV